VFLTTNKTLKTMLPMLMATTLVSEGVKVAVKPGFEKFIEPHLDSIKDWLKERKLNHKVELFESQFTEYLGSIFINSEFINVLIFPNEQVAIDSFYEPLTITAKSTRERFSIGKTDLDFLIQYKKIIVSDTAGMGKSTLMKWITRQCVKRYLGIPLLIELRKINPGNSLMQEIFSQLGQLGEQVDQDFIIKLLIVGKFIIIFDGYDEISQDVRDYVTQEILLLVNKAHQNYFILTSRPDPALATFGNFKGFNIESLTEKQYTSIIRKCDSISNLGIADSLIKDISNRGRDIENFLSNPFLVTLLYNCYVYNRNIPVRKSSFYDEIYTALFKHHDLSKDKYERKKQSGLDIYNFRLVLRKFAFDSARTGTTDFTETSLIEGIKKAQEMLVGVPAFNAIDFADDVIKQVPLMVKEGLHIKWSHKSLQDYFAAESICYNENKSKIILSIFESETFYVNHNLFDFIVEMDYALIRENILYPILLKFREHAEHMKSMCAVPNEEALKRASLTFDRDIFIAKKQAETSNIFPAIRGMAKRNINGYFSKPFRNLRNEECNLLVADSNTSNVLSIIKNKAMEDIFATDTYYPIKANEVYPLDLPKENIVSHLNDSTIMGNPNPAFQNTITNIISNSVHGTILDYTKSIAVLTDIETQLKKRKQDDKLLF
jgi:hypothetical protein